MFLFVYGSLKKDFKYHYILEPLGAFVCKASTISKYSLYEYQGSGFPYLSKTEHSSIKGELYEIDDLAKIDVLEEYPTFYDREQIDIIGDNGFKYKAYCYFLKEKIIEKKEPFSQWTLSME